MHVVDTIEATAKEYGVEKVTKLRMEVGEVSTVVPELFEDAFDWAKKRTQYLRDCELELIIIQGISYCRSCRSTYETTKYAKKCPNCGSYDTYLVTGNEINIKDIEVWGGKTDAELQDVELQTAGQEAEMTDAGTRDDGPVAAEKQDVAAPGTDQPGADQEKGISTASDNACKP